MQIISAKIASLDRGWCKRKVAVVGDEAEYLQELKVVAAVLDGRPDNRLV